MHSKTWVAAIVCLVGSIIVGSIDLVATAVQVPVALLLLFGGVLGIITGGWAWAWGLVLGCSVFCAHVLAAACGYKAPYQVQPNIYATFLAVIPAMLGSLCGAGLGWVMQQRQVRI